MTAKQKKISNKEIILIILFFGFGFYTLIEDKIQDFSSIKQIINSVGLPIVLISGFFSVIVMSKSLTNSIHEIGIVKWIISRLIIMIVFGFLVTIPLLGIISLINRTMPPQTTYVLKGKIIEIDSSQVYNRGSYRAEYNMKIKSSDLNRIYKFDITHDDYKVWKDSSSFQLKLNRGVFGYLYLIK